MHIWPTMGIDNGRTAGITQCHVIIRGIEQCRNTPAILAQILDLSRHYIVRMCQRSSIGTGQLGQLPGFDIAQIQRGRQGRRIIAHDDRILTAHPLRPTVVSGRTWHTLHMPGASIDHIKSITRLLIDQRNQARAIRRPGKLFNIQSQTAELLQPCAIRCHAPDFIETAFIGQQGDTGAVGRANGIPALHIVIWSKAHRITRWAMIDHRQQINIILLSAPLWRCRKDNVMAIRRPNRGTAFVARKRHAKHPASIKWHHCNLGNITFLGAKGDLATIRRKRSFGSISVQLS